MRHAKINPAAALTIALPLFAIVASVGTAVVAVTRGDPPLPDQYHWEGDKLDHDFAESTRASELHLRARLDLRPEQGLCHLTLALDGNNVPPWVDLALIHVSNPMLDRNIRFVRSRVQPTPGSPMESTAGASLYSAPCTPLPAARWHIELSSPEGGWSFRSATTDPQAAITALSSSSPTDDSGWPRQP